MFGLLRSVIAWSVRHVLIFALVLAGLAIAWTWREQDERRQALAAETTLLENQRRTLAADIARQRAGAAEVFARIETLERSALQRRLAAIRAELAGMDAPRLSRTTLAVDLMRGRPDAIARDLGANFRLQLLRREEALIASRMALTDGEMRLTTLAAEIARTDARARVLRGQVAAIERENPILTGIDSVPALGRFVGPWRDLNARRAEAARLERRSQALRQARRTTQQGFGLVSDRYRLARNGLQSAAVPGGELDQAIADGRTELERNTASRIRNAVEPVFWSAIWILAAIIVAPVLVKLFWFYGVAPHAARLAPIRIRPDLDGDIDWATDRVTDAVPNASAVSRHVVLHPGEELLIRPQYLQSSMAGARIDTAPLLNRDMILGSLATGLTALTRVRVTHASTATLSATQDMIDEVGVIDIADGSAMVFHPRNLVGVIQRIDRPVRIESHWRLGHLSSWLTLQLRFLVFHGPVALVVTGARGVALEPAPGGRLIAGAATMGWSVGLAYSVRRSETFFAYLTGKQSLFNDGFEGARGKVLYEQMPRARSRSGLWGRGLEGLGDGMMKVFGL